MFPLGLFALVLPFAAFQDSQVYVPKNISASYLVERLGGRLFDPFQGQQTSDGKSLLPEGLKYGVDASTNRILVSGRSEDIAKVLRYMPLFDIPPKRIEMQLEERLPHLSYSFSNAIIVANNSRWTLSEPVRGLEVSIVPRLNDDGYATIMVEHKLNGVTTKVVARAKLGESLYIDHSGQASTSPDIFNGSSQATSPPFRLKLRLVGVAKEQETPKKGLH